MTGIRHRSGPFPQKFTPDKNSYRYERGVVCLGSGGYDAKNAYLTFSRREHMADHGAAKGGAVLGKVIYGLGIMNRWKNGDTITRIEEVFSITDSTNAKVTSDLSVVVKEGMQIFSELVITAEGYQEDHAEIDCGCTESVEHMLFCLRENRLQIDRISLQSGHPAEQVNRERGFFVIQRDVDDICEIHRIKRDFAFFQDLEGCLRFLANDDSSFYISVVCHHFESACFHKTDGFTERQAAQIKELRNRGNGKNGFFRGKLGEFYASRDRPGPRVVLIARHVAYIDIQTAGSFSRRSYRERPFSSRFLAFLGNEEFPFGVIADIRRRGAVDLQPVFTQAEKHMFDRFRASAVDLRMIFLISFCGDHQFGKYLHPFLHHDREIRGHFRVSRISNGKNFFNPGLWCRRFSSGS